MRLNNHRRKRLRRKIALLGRLPSYLKREAITSVKKKTRARVKIRWKGQNSKVEKKQRQHLRTEGKLLASKTLGGAIS